VKKKDGDGPGDEIDLLIQKLRWLRLPGMTKLVASLLERATKDNLSSLDVIHRLSDDRRRVQAFLIDALALVVQTLGDQTR